jgi:uncharacterized protein (TIGR02611 family)
MSSAKHKWQRTPAAVRKPVVLIAGVAVVIAGIILLPLPGPGWVVIFLGFAVLATEFAAAEKVRDKMVAIFKQVLEYCKHLWRKLRKKR